MRRKEIRDHYLYEQQPQKHKSLKKQESYYYNALRT